MKTFLSVLFIGLVPIGNGGGRVHAADHNLPDRPYYYVSDELNSLSPQAKHAAESLLVEHARLTGQIFMTAVLKTEEMGVSREIFNSWKLNESREGNSVLLLLYQDNLQSKFEIGVGLESDSSESSQALFGVHGLNQKSIRGGLNENLTGQIYRALESLGSPLIQSGKAAAILQDDGLELPASVDTETPEVRAWVVTLFLSLSSILLAFVFFQFLAREAHFTSSGWFRHHPFKFSNPFRTQSKDIKLPHLPDPKEGVHGRW
jgi:hypothetical protein